MLVARLVRRFVAVAVALLALAAVSQAVGGWAGRRAERAGAARSAEEAAEASRRVREHATALLLNLEARAERVAADPAVVRALAADSVRAPTVDRRVLDAVAGDQRGAATDDGASTELYTPDLRLVAWRGLAAPMEARERRPGFADSIRTGVVTDGGGRRLAVWYPVMAHGRRVGAVRALQLVQQAVPVRNRFLRDYDVADAWRAETGLPLSVVFAERAAAPAGTTPLVGGDGTTLGWVRVMPPGADALAERARASGRSAAAFFLVLAMGWGLAGLGALRRRTMRVAARGPTRRRWTRAGLAFGAWAAAGWAARFALLALDVPALWTAAGQEPAHLLDPAFLGSDVAGGLMRSPLDLAITMAWAAVFAAALLRFALVHSASPPRDARLPGFARAGAALLAAGAVSALALLGIAVAARRAVVDSTLDYFARSGPIPDPLSLVVLASLLAGAGAAVAIVTAALVLARTEAGRPLGGRGGQWALPLGALALTGAGLAVAVGAAGVPLSDAPPAAAAALLALVAVAAAAFLRRRSDGWAWPLTFRGLLLGVLVLTPPVYLLMLRANQDRGDALLVEAAEGWAGGQDRRAVFAIEQVLADARAEDALRPALLVALEATAAARAGGPAPDSARLAAVGLAADSARTALEDVVASLVSGSLLASLPDYTVSLAVISPAGDTLAVHRPGGGPAIRPRGSDSLDFPALRERYESEGEAGFLVRRAPVPRRRGVFRYAGLGPIQALPEVEPVAWVLVRAVPQPPRQVAETPYPRVLVPAGLFGDEGEPLAYAEYENGVLVRSEGEPVGPAILDSAVARALATGAPFVRRRERVESEQVRAYYVRTPRAGAGAGDAIAVRAPAVAPYDHLFHLLRLTVAGLALAALVFVIGAPARRRAGLLPGHRTRFRDVVLNRFLLVGIASVALTGVLGQLVVEEQSRQAVRTLLRQRLQRVEAAVLDATAPPEGAAEGAALPDVLSTVRPDLIAATLGVDLHLYAGPNLVGSSRPQLVRQRLIDRRMPARVYRSLFVDGAAYTFNEDRIGEFAYTTGFKALRNAQGRTVGAVAVPTLPEQASIEAGRARMVAYLFGALLLLLLVVFVLATLLADQVTRPFRRLRAGLRAVGAGEMDRPIPVETRDEMGALAEAFNAMQAQLAESRRRLSAQERELAWREMARQVAHEIKNPLMPMKLSVQHLRRLFSPPGEDAPPDAVRFASQFERTTATLVEQMDALDRIAGAFSSYARLPKRAPELLDLNDVAREACGLFADEAARAAVGAAGARLDVDLTDESLPVRADREELRRALINLLKNALQSLDGTRPGHVVLRTLVEPAPPGTDGPGRAVAEVQDNGRGIPRLLRPRVFQPNFSTKSSGTGLGLAIVQRDVEAAGGAVGFATSEGVGSTFTVRLPLVAPAAPARGAAGRDALQR